MLVFDFGKYILDIDVNKTREFYGQAKALTDRCDCQGCRNYAAWAEVLSPEAKGRLETMGLSLEKAQEVYVKCRFPDGTLSYAGWYHLRGRILEGQDPWVRIDDRGAVSCKRVLCVHRRELPCDLYRGYFLVG